MSQATAISKGQPTTSSESYLLELCERSFLSLWSYPGVYRDQHVSGVGDGKEVCDLLVVFGENVLIFSDKKCEFPNSGKVDLDWARWFRRAAGRSAKQAWGAERWIKEYPSRLFLDRKCTRRIPIDVASSASLKFHLVVVAHGVSDIIRKTFGGSGSLMISSTIQGLEKHNDPFHIGDLDPRKSFVHVLDDDSLETVMRTRDTVSDFVAYLEKRARLLRGKPFVIAAGEEELLAIYLKSMNETGEHDFVFPADEEPLDFVTIPEGFWESFKTNPQRLAQLQADQISYSWDALIEKFSHFAIEGKQHFVTSGGFKDSERILRFMAAESRFKRRCFSTALMEMLATTPAGHQRIRVLPPGPNGGPHYVFVLYPSVSHTPATSYEEYRSVRREFLEACCLVAKAKFGAATDIVGLATESDVELVDRSEDAIHLDAREWSDAQQEESLSLSTDLHILTAPNEVRGRFKEYPDVPKKKRKMGRNEPCFCGSGKKYKTCHLE